MRARLARSVLLPALWLAAAPGLRAQAAPLTLPLWPGAPPGGAPGGSTGRDVPRPPDPERGAITRVTDVAAPTLTLYRPAGRGTGAAVVVFPGGGYQLLAIDLEGTEVCRWLVDAGVACALVRYRVPQTGVDSARWVKPVQDGERAVRLARLHAREWGIDPGRVGVLGFSAGGDLAAVLSNRGPGRDYAPVDAADTLASRPDFAVLIYPAYLVRGRQDARLRPEARPSAASPPTFLAQAMDDPVGVENAAAYALALHDAGVPAELHLYATGGHGYGLRAAAGEVAAAWPDLALRWLAHLGMIPGR